MNMKRIIITLIFTAMTAFAFSQNMPEVDKLNTSAGEVEMYFIGHGSLMFRINDFVIYVDPVRSYGNYDKLPKADLILVTHEHSDHLDTDLLKTLRKDATVMLCNAAAAAKVPWAGAIKPGDTKTVDKIRVEAIPAYNIVNERSKGQPFHPRGVGNGYIITIGDKRIYVAGDTENIPEMKALKNIDVAFLPMNLPYTMTPAMVADAAKAFRPKVLYPYHYGDTNPAELVNLLKGTNIEVRIRKLK
jgi:L-ascorbate metabolism protein UlaG (beta-lactamase superfamily)